MSDRPPERVARGLQSVGASMHAPQHTPHRDASPARFWLHEEVEIAPLSAERFAARVPSIGASVEGTRYHMELLESFADWSVPQDVLSQFPFDRGPSEAFIAACISQGILQPANTKGKPALPLRTRPATTLFQTPHFDASTPPAFAFLGVPFDYATTLNPGARFGPSAIRQHGNDCRYTVEPATFEPAGFYDMASGRSLLHGITLADAGDVYIAPGEAPAAIFERVTRSVQEILAAGSIPMVMGGDHSITHAVIRAFEPRTFGIIHLDAHTDLGTAPFDGGIHHGTVFSNVLEDFSHVERLVQVGLRGFVDGAGQESFACVSSFGIDTFRRSGVETILAAMPDDIPYYMSVDIDVVDPTFAPATGTPVPGGLYPHELKDLVHQIASRRDIIGFDLCEVARPTGPMDQTAVLASDTVLTAADGIVARSFGHPRTI